jgi:hypothetical protein
MEVNMTQDKSRYLCGESDIFVGRKSRLKRYLVCSMGGQFPVLVKTGPNSLAAIFRTGGNHISISATLAVATSSDGGKSWSDPREITRRWEDSRNPALGVNSKGELIAAFWKAGLISYEKGEYDNLQFSEKLYSEGKFDDRVLKATVITKSSDNGVNWNEMCSYSSEILTTTIPYGRIIPGSGGALYMSAYGRLRSRGKEEYNAVLICSRDDGQTWGHVSIIGSGGFSETAIAFVDDSTMIAAARSDKDGIHILRSSDSGRTWSEPIKVTRYEEHPADITIMSSGRVLLTYGRRIRPMGCGALLSSDCGKTWDRSKEVLLAGDGILNLDLGYPSTVQLDDGSIVTALYYANGSEMHDTGSFDGWGYVSCQAIHYREEDIC